MLAIRVRGLWSALNHVSPEPCNCPPVATAWKEKQAISGEALPVPLSPVQVGLGAQRSWWAWSSLGGPAAFPQAIGEECQEEQPQHQGAGPQGWGRCLGAWRRKRQEPVWLFAGLGEKFHGIC